RAGLRPSPSAWQTCTATSSTWSPPDDGHELNRVGPRSPSLSALTRVEVPVGGIGGGGVKGGEFGAELVGVGVVEVVKNGEGLVPSFACGVVVAGGVVGVAEVGEDVGFCVAVAKVAVQGEGVAVVGEGVGVVAEVVVGVADAVPGLGLPVAVAQFL